MASAVVGKYKLDSSENFDEFLKALGVNFLMRKAAGVQTPVVEIKEEDGTFTIRTETTFKTQEIKFKLGEEFEESRLDGVTVKSKIEQDGNKLVQQQFGEPACEIIREVDGDILKTVCTIGDVVSTRIYKRI